MKKLVFFLFLFFNLISCKNAENERIKREILGNWHIESAYRDNNETETLSGIFFLFKNDSLATNFNEELVSKTTKYSINDKFITIKETPSIKYHVDSISQNYLLLNITLQNRKFDLILKKSI
jgi:hypothetical protein